MADKRQFGAARVVTKLAKVAASKNRARSLSGGAKKAARVVSVEKASGRIFRLRTSSGELQLTVDALRNLAKDLNDIPAVKPTAPAKRIRIAVLEVKTGRQVKAIQSPPLVQADKRQMRVFTRATAKVLTQYGNSRRYKIIQIEA